MRNVLPGQTDYTVLVKIVDVSGAPVTGLTNSDIDIAYSRVETDNDVTTTDVTPASLSTLTDAHTDWGFKEISAADHPGLYRLDIADAVFASGAWEAAVTITDASGTDFQPVDVGFRFPDDPAGVTTLLSRLSSARAGYLDNINNTNLLSTVAQTGDSYARLGAPAGASVSADVAAVKTDTGNLASRITSTLFSGITSLAQWLGMLAGKQTGNSTARTELRATGAGSGTFDETTDSQEALRDRGDAAYLTATSAALTSAGLAAVSRVVHRGKAAVYYAGYGASDDSGDGLTPATAKQTVSAAMALASAGDILDLSEGTFTLSATFTVPAGVKLRGAGMDRTIIDATNISSPTSAVGVKWSTGCEIEDLHIYTDPAVGDYRFPVGNGSGDSAATGVVMRRVRITADSDGVCVFGAACSAELYDCLIETKYDAVRVLSTSGSSHVRLYRCTWRCVGPSSRDSGNQVQGVSVGNGLVECFECHGSGSGGNTQNNAYHADGTGTLRIYGGSGRASGTGAAVLRAENVLGASVTAYGLAFDGSTSTTGTATVTVVPVPANTTQISGDLTAADNLEAVLDGTGGVDLDLNDVVAASVTVGDTDVETSLDDTNGLANAIAADTNAIQATLASYPSGLAGTVAASPSPSTGGFDIDIGADRATNFLKGAFCVITSGSGAKQARKITTDTRISSTVHRLTFAGSAGESDEAFVVAPAAADLVLVLGRA